jgi:DNA-binding NtrC family response regulator
MNLQLKFFLVDDSSFFTTIYDYHLRNRGFNEIYTFNNGTDCLNNLHKSPNIILLDHFMDDINGLEVLKKIKRTFSNIYVVMISSQIDTKIAIDAMKNGAFDYIVKDDNIFKELDGVINKIISLKKGNKDLKL